MKLINHKYLEEIDVTPVQQFGRQGSYKANDFFYIICEILFRVARYPRLISRRI